MTHRLAVKCSGGVTQIMCVDCLDCVGFVDHGDSYTIEQLTSMETQHRTVAIKAELENA